MRRPSLALLVLTPLLALLAPGCGDDTPPDQQAFCQRLDRLAGNDPFRSFGDRATPGEIEDAFAALVERADELVDVAPGQVKGPAKDYAESAEALDELLAAAAYDGDQVDASAYRRRQVDYAEAAATLERYLAAEC